MPWPYFLSPDRPWDQVPEGITRTFGDTLIDAKHSIG